MEITYITWTLDEWLEQQALIQFYRRPFIVTPDIINRIERLEEIVFEEKENDRTDIN